VIPTGFGRVWGRHGTDPIPCVLRRDDLEARFPGLLNAVLDAARRDDVGAHVGLADDAPTA
jgi:hypothetical protein